MTQFEQPLADWPQMTLLKKEGGVHITGRYTQPGLVNTIWVPYLMLALFFVLAGSTSQAEKHFLPALILCTAIAFAAYYFIWKPVMLGFFQKNVDVKVFPGRIQVRHWFSYRNYARSVPIEFRIEQHQKAIREAQKGGAHMTYRQAMEVVMWYGEKRIVLAEMPQTDMQLAQALVFRLQTVIGKMDEMIERMALGGVTGTPTANEFGPAPEVR